MTVLKPNLRPAAALALVLGLWVVAAVLTLWSPRAGAQTITPAQLQLLRQLPPEQLQALLEQFASGAQGEAEAAPGAEPGAITGTEENPMLPGILGALGTQPDEDAAAVIEAGDTILVDVRPQSETAPGAIPDTDANAAARREAIRSRVLNGNPYRVDREGAVELPGFRTIPLAGLTAEQATERLSKEPAFEQLTVRVTRLTLAPRGADALEPFGYDLFLPPGAGERRVRQAQVLPPPVRDVPVPAEYVVGPGDVLRVQLLGNTKGSYNLVVGREGDIRLPEIGPVTVAGLSFPDAEAEIQDTVKAQLIGTRAVVGMGQLRTIQVFVTGEVKKPGATTVTGLSTVTTVLLASGGVKEIGSLRTIQLKRGGRTVQTLDLYDLLLRGDDSDDARVMAGDVVFVPPVGATAGITGEVRRPAIYEFRRDATVGQLVGLSGGLTPEADPGLATVERIDADRGRVVLTVDLKTAAGRDTRLRAGDLVTVERVQPTLVNSVTVRGHVYRTRNVQHRAGLRIGDILRSPDDFKPNADLRYVLVRREQLPERQVHVLSADMAAVWADPSSPANIRLEPRDEIIVLDMEGGRERALAEVLRQLDEQGTADAPSRRVQVAGMVRMPGVYPLGDGMTVRDLLRAAGGLDEAAFGGKAELTRYEVQDGQTRRTSLVEVDLAAVAAGDPAANLALKPFDLLHIKELSNWRAEELVVVEGEVRFPGTYPIRRGETLSQVLERAGGPTDYAFLEGSVFTRRTLQERESRQIGLLADRLERELAALSVQTSQSLQPSLQTGQSLAAARSLLDELRNTTPVGRLVVDLPKLLAGGGQPQSNDVILKDGDRLLIPRQTQEVTVLGEVQTTTSHLHTPGLPRDEYIALSGGTTNQADRDRIYVVRANGSVVTGNRNRWLVRADDSVQPGDTIVVPVDTDRLPPLPLWTSVTTIIYNLAVAVAAVNSF